jgi:aryl-alcohol dehydrogenase-like predicted oxidoreductase
MQGSELFLHCVLGTAGLGGVWGKVNKEESVKAILIALNKGISCIDTAPAYGDAEEFIGTALRQWEGPMPILSTKVGRLKTYAADQGVYDYSADGMEKSVINSLETLGVQTVDILFLHEPLAVPKDEIERVLAQLLKFKKNGYTKKLGVGGNCHELFKKYNMGETFDVAMEFNRLDACYTDALDTSLPFYQSQEIEFYAASPLHMGLLGNRFEEYVVSPPQWVDKDIIDRAKLVKEIADRCQMPLRSLSHRFLLSVRENLKIVIGPGDSDQLCETISDFSQGPLPASVFEEIMNFKN